MLDDIEVILIVIVLCIILKINELFYDKFVIV
jgi:hypothetical protein